jgi:hypothetical protein
VKKENPELWNAGLDSNPTFVASSFIGYLLGLAEDNDHRIELIPFNGGTDLPPLTAESNVSKLSIETLHKYVGTLVRIGDNWKSFEFKMYTSIPAPSSFVRTPLLTSGAQNPLVDFLQQHHLHLHTGNHWGESKYPLWLLEQSDIADDPEEIHKELNQRIIKLTDEPAPKMRVEWRVVEASLVGTDPVAAAGIYIIGDLQSEDQIEYAIGKLKRDSSYPFTGHFVFGKARGCTKSNDSLNSIHRNLKAQEKYSKNLVYFTIKGLPYDNLNLIPTDPSGLSNESPNSKTVKQLLLNLQSITKIGKGGSRDEIVFVGNASNVKSLTAIAPQVLEKLQNWAGVNDGKLDLTTLVAPFEDELKMEPGMLILTPQASPGYPHKRAEQVPTSSSPQASASAETELERMRECVTTAIESSTKPPQVSNAPEFRGETQKKGEIPHWMAQGTEPPRLDSLAQTVAGLSSDMQQIKSMLSNCPTLAEIKSIIEARPNEIAASSVITDALSSLSDKLNTVSSKITLNGTNFDALKAESERILQAVANNSGNNELDQLIVRSHLYEDQLFSFPNDCREEDIVLPAHGSDPNLPLPHKHPKEEEDRLNNLGLEEVVNLIRSSPSFVDHSRDTDICLNCRGGNDKGRLAIQCAVCMGLYHEKCQDILDYNYDEGKFISACERCRTIRQHEIAIALMFKCTACSTWIRKKKEEAATMTKEQQYRLRSQQLVLLREDMVPLNVQALIDQTDAAIKAATNDQPSEEQDVEFDTNTDGNTYDPDMSVATPAAVVDLTVETSTAASKKGATDGTAEDQHLSDVAAYKSEITSSYNSRVPNDSIFDNLIHNWMEEREIAIESATAKLKQNIEDGTYEVERNILDSSDSPELLPHELDTIKHFSKCHSLFWPTESKSDATGICPFAEANRHWLEDSGLSTTFPACDCTEGYDLNTVDLISHLQSHHSHWVSKIASFILMEHDVLTGMHLPCTPASTIKEPRSPHQPQKLFKSTNESPSTGNKDDTKDEPKVGTFPAMRHSKLLAGIAESSSEEANDQHDSESDTDSESKRYVKAKAARFGEAKKDEWTKRLRDRKSLLKMVDDGESSVTSVSTNLDT